MARVTRRRLVAGLPGALAGAALLATTPLLLAGCTAPPALTPLDSSPTSSQTPGVPGRVTPAAPPTAVEYEEIPAPGGIYIEALIGRPRYLNPLFATPNSPDDDITALVFAGLTRLNQTGDVVPDLASDWETGPDGLTYTFRLRADARWQDGQPVTADDVLYTYQIIRDPEFRGPSSLADFWRGIRTEKLDDGRLRFWLKQPFAPFLEYCALGILPSHLLASVPVRSLAEQPFSASPVGAGLYRVANARIDRVSLEPSPTSRDPKPLLAGVEFRFFPAAEPAMIALRAGEVGGLGVVPPDLLPSLAALPSIRLVSRPDAGKLTLLIFNSSHPLLAEKPARQALALAIDRAKVAAAALGPGAVPAFGPASPTSWASDPSASVPAADLERAAALLEAAGWKLDPADKSASPVRQRAGQPLELALLTNDAPEHVHAAEEIVRQLAGVGVRVTVQAAGWTGVLQDFLVPGKFQATLVTQSAASADPDLFAYWHSSQAKLGLNFGGWANEKADALLAQARSTPGRAERAAIYHEFQTLFAEEAPAVPLYSPLLTNAISSTVKGVPEPGIRLRPADRFAGLASWYTRTQKVPRSR